MDHSHSAINVVTVLTGTPTLFSIASAIIFMGMIAFYIVRAFHPKAVESCCGYYGPWQEVAHVLCALGMLAMSIPKYFLAIPPLAWVILFSTFTLIYLVELLMRERGSKPSARWCIIQAGFFAGIAYMFWGPSWILVTLGFIVFYSWGIAFFVQEFIQTISVKPVTPLSLGVDIFHALVAITMALMFLFPSTFMPKMPMCTSVG